MIYPWLQSGWQQITQSIDSLHHGLLINGPNGIGKIAFAESLAQLLLCDNRSQQTETTNESTSACGDCQKCRLFLAGTHPDFHVLTSELLAGETESDVLTAYADRYQDAVAREKRANPSRVIPIDHVRQLIQRFTTSSHIAAHRVAMIVPADSMNISSANALLKLLEEPPENASLILVTDTPGFLPATVRSRCMSVVLSAPQRDNAITWLEAYLPIDSASALVDLIDGGPLAVLQAHEAGYLESHALLLGSVAALSDRRSNGVEVAASLSKQDFRGLIMWLQRFVVELIKWRSSASLPPWRDQIALRLDRISLQSLFFLYDKIAYYQRIAREQLNEQLALEDLMLILHRVLR